MTTIKASCPTCGDVELTAHQVRLVVCSVRTWSYYAFSCATCLEEVRKPAGRDVVALLISGGVIAEPWAVPAEALEFHEGPAPAVRRRARLRAVARPGRPGRRGRRAAAGPARRGRGSRRPPAPRLTPR